MQTEWLLEVEGVTVAFGGIVAVDDVSFRVRAGEVLGVIGPNGAGKTTLFNALTALVPLSHGDVKLSGASVSGWTTHRIARAGIARTLQTPEIFPQITVRENMLAAILSRQTPWLIAVGLGLPSARRCEARAGEEADRLLRDSLLRDEGGRLAGDLPFGHQRLLEIYRALALDPRVLLLDEPLSGLTREEAGVVLGLIRQIRGAGRAVLLVEHDLPSVLAVADRIVVLAEGRLIAEGTPAEVQRDENVRRVYLGREAGQERAAGQGGMAQ